MDFDIFAQQPLEIRHAVSLSVGKPAQVWEPGAGPLLSGSSAPRSPCGGNLHRG